MSIRRFRIVALLSLLALWSSFVPVAVAQQVVSPAGPPIVPPNVAPGATGVPLQTSPLAPNASQIFRQGAGIAGQVGPGGEVTPLEDLGTGRASVFHEGADLKSGGQRGDYNSIFTDPQRPRAHRLQPSADVLAQYQKYVPEVVDPEVPMKLNVGIPRILRFETSATEPKLKLYIPDERVARWDILSNTEVAVVGLEVGETVLTVWVNDPEQPGGVKVLSYLLQVHESESAGPSSSVNKVNLQEELCRAFPDSSIRLSLVAGELVVRGQAKDAVESQQIIELLERMIRNRGGGDDQQVIVATGQATILSEVRNASFANLLTVPGEQQVNLRVSVAEINRSALRRIGADMRIGQGEVSFLSLVGGTNFIAPTGRGSLTFNRPDFRLVLNALRRLNLARSLAEPNLTALNGRAANFFVGDNVPLPNAVAGFGGVGQSVVFTRVGIQLSFTPYVIDRNRIRLQLQGFVSSLDPDAQQVNVGGSNVSTQNARSFQTTLDLRDGETMALAGLISNTYSASDARLPLVGDFPYVGNLFGNKEATLSEQELVVLVTPELVHPLKKCDVPPLPGYDVFEPTDVEFFMQNRLEARRTRDYRSAVRTDNARIKAGHRCWEDQFIIGRSGYSYGCCQFEQESTTQTIVHEVIE